MERLENVVDSFDWREKNVLTKVRKQGRCNCCWAITAASAVEFLVNKQSTNVGDELLVLSPQHLIDYAVEDLTGHRLDSRGCYSYHYKKAFTYIMTHGISKENDYPFKARREPHRQDPKPFLKIHTFKRINIEDLESQLQHQPVAAAMRVTRELEDWKKEVYRGPPTMEDLDAPLRHAVLVVGFGREENNEKIWIVKNSWGEDWGHSGFGRVSQKLVGTKPLLESLHVPEGIEYFQ